MGVLGTIAAVGAATIVHGQDYPGRPVRLIAPLPAGSTPDQIARVIGPQLHEAFGQPFIVENKSGALGTLGAAEVARSAPDGHTLLLATNTTHAADVALFKKLPYDPAKDFAPIMRLATTSMVLVVRSDFPARDLRQFIAHARAKSGSLTAAYGTAGSLVSIAKLKSRGGFSTVDIPYKGSNLAVADVLAGHVEFTFADFAVAFGQIKGGRVRGLAVTSATRSPLAPDLPSVAEELPGSETIVWYGLVAPAGTPREIIDKLYQATTKIMAREDVRTRFETAGLSVAPLSPDQFSGFIRSEITKWGIEVKEAGIQAQ